MAYKQNEIDTIFNDICTKIGEGMAVRNVLKLKGMPAPETFYKWINESESKAKQYARACELRADTMFEDMLDIADDSSNDTITDEDGKERMNSEFVQRSRLRVDARKWALSKLNPKKYGDKIDMTTDGESINNKPLSQEQALMLLNELKNKD